MTTISPLFSAGSFQSFQPRFSEEFVFGSNMSEPVAKVARTEETVEEAEDMHLRPADNVDTWSTNDSSDLLFWTICLSSGNLTLWKIAIWLSKNCQKLDIFSKKFARNFHFFQKNGNFFFLKEENFWQFFWKNENFWLFFDSQMAIFRRVSWELWIVSFVFNIVGNVRTALDNLYCI